MTVAFEVRIGDLLPEFLADTLIVLGAFQTAGTVAAGALETVTNGLDHFLILIQTNCHSDQLLWLYYKPVAAYVKR